MPRRLQRLMLDPDLCRVPPEEWHWRSTTMVGITNASFSLCKSQVSFQRTKPGNLNYSWRPIPTFLHIDRSLPPPTLTEPTQNQHCCLLPVDHSCHKCHNHGNTMCNLPPSWPQNLSQMLHKWKTPPWFWFQAVSCLVHVSLPFSLTLGSIRSGFTPRHVHEWRRCETAPVALLVGSDRGCCRHKQAGRNYMHAPWLQWNLKVSSNLMTQCQI